MLLEKSIQLAMLIRLEPETISSKSVGDRATAFQAVDGHQETVAGGPLLVAAYALLWLIVFALIIRIFQRQNTIARDLSKLELSLHHNTAKPKS